jgi:hypothetical protein
MRHLPCQASVVQKASAWRSTPNGIEVWKRSTEAWKRESTKIRPPCIRPISDSMIPGYILQLAPQRAAGIQ